MRLYIFDSARWMAWFQRWKQPEQLELPFFCELHGDVCEFRYDPGLHGAFYTGRCWKCGVRYDPVCDR